MIDIENIAVQRAKTQLRGLRFDGEEPDRWAMAGGRRCADCGRRLFTGNTSPLCPTCKNPPRRARCWACDARAEVKGYCRRHYAHIRDNGVVDPLHVDTRREGHGAPKGGRFV